MVEPTKTILLVEDDPDHEVLTIRALRKANVANEIRVAHDGEEALNLLFGSDENALKVNPQVVLLDLKLPKVEGLEVLRRIRESERTRMLGVNSYIRKPVNFSEFAEATRQLGMYWLVLNECPPSSS
jgi:PleD family two-component response regulator